MPETTEAELTALESKTETVRLLRLAKEEENAALDLELEEAKSKLGEIQRNKGDFESTLNGLDDAAEAKRAAVKEAERRHKRDVEDFKADMEAVKQAGKDQMRALTKERVDEERKLKESLDDLAVIEFKVASAAQDIDNMRRRIEVQKDQLKTSQKFVDKLEKERREVEVMFEKLRAEHDRLREDNQKAEMDNVQAQLKLTPEGRQQYLQEAAKREERRPATPSKKAKSAAAAGRRRRPRAARDVDDDYGTFYGSDEEFYNDADDDDDAYSVVSSRRGSYSTAGRHNRHRREDSEERAGYDRLGGGGGGGVSGARGRRVRDLDDDLPPAPRRRSVDSAFARETSLRPRGRTEREMSVLSARAARLARESADTGSGRVVVGADGEPELGRGLAGLRAFMMSTPPSKPLRKLRGPRERELSGLSEF